MLPELQPIIDEPAFLIKEKKLLVIADLHIGIESELRENGLQVPSQTNLMEQRLISLLETNTIHDIILLGDIKHNIPLSTIQERTDVNRFLTLFKHMVPFMSNLGTTMETSIDCFHQQLSYILPMALCLKG